MRLRHATGCCAGRIPRTRWVGLLWLLAPMLFGCTTGPFASSTPLGGSAFVAPSVPSATPGSVLTIPNAAPGLTLSPGRLIAPIGTEVILKVKVADNAARPLTSERVEWSLSNQGVGFLIAPPRPGFFERMTKWDATPERIDHHNAVSRTSQRYLTMTRGTASPADDVVLRPGEAWIGVSSRAEGTSHVRAFAPDLMSSNRPCQVAQIHWIDAQWQFPSPGANMAGSSHRLTTTVSRHTNGLPVVGWLVRYWIASGSPATLGANSAQLAEVLTDKNGQAHVEIKQLEKTYGTSQVGIQIIRPVDPARGIEEQLVVGTGATSVAWSTASLGVKCTAPTNASIGSTARFVIEVTNPGDLAAKNVVVTARIPKHLSLLENSGDASREQGSLSWTIGDLAAGSSRRFEVDVRPTRAGHAVVAVEVRAAESLAAESSAALLVSGRRRIEASLSLERPVDQIRLGDKITFQIRLTNRGDAPLTGIVIKDSFPPGLVHASGKSPVVLNVGALGSGESHNLGITFRIAEAGHLTQNLVVTADGNVTTTARNQITAIDPRPKVHPDMIATVAGPVESQVGETIALQFEITNKGDVPLTDVVGICRLPASFEPLQTNHFEAVDGVLTWKTPRLAVGDSVQAIIKCRTNQIVPNAVCHFEVVSTEGVNRRETLSTRVVRPPRDRPQGKAKLALTVSDTSDPVRRGDTIAYVISLTNDGNAVDRNVVLEVHLPPGLSFIKNAIRAPASAKFFGQVARFEPVLQFRPAETPLEYRLHVQADVAGSHRVVVRLKSDSTPDVVVAEETTSVVQ